MATVRISAELKHAIVTRITDMERQAQARLGIPEMIMELGASFLAEKLERSMWGEHYHLKDQLPDKWKTKVDRFYIELRTTDNVRYKHQVHIGAFLPPANNVYEVLHVNVAEILSEVLRNRLHDTLTEYAANRVKYAHIKQEIEALLDAAGSLNAVLKKYPDIALYVPDAYIDRVNASTERTKSSTLETITVDIDTIVATGVQHALNRE